MLVREQRGDDDHADPVPRADADAETDCAEQRDCRRVACTSAGEHTAHAEPRRDRVQALRSIDLDVEERIEEVEACDPKRNRKPERPRFPRQLARDRDPAADGREAVDHAEPEMAEPGPALETGIDDEADERYRPQPAHHWHTLDASYETGRKRR